MNVDQELANLQRKTSGELAEVYAELFGETCRSRNKVWLICPFSDSGRGFD